MIRKMKQLSEFKQRNDDILSYEETQKFIDIITKVPFLADSNFDGLVISRKYLCLKKLPYLDDKYGFGFGDHCWGLDFTDKAGVLLLDTYVNIDTLQNLINNVKY